MSAAEEYITQEVTRSRVGAMTYLAPRNKLVGDSIESFKSVVSDCIEKNETHIIVDLATTALINSAALEVLLDAQDELIKLGGSLKIANVKDNILEVFQITGFKNAISILKTDGQATVITAIQKDFKENVRLGDILLAKGIITAAQIEEGLKLQEVTGKKIGQVIVDRGWVSEQEILEALSEQLSVPYIRLRSGLYDPEIVNLLDKNVAKRLKVLPLFKIREELSLATADAQAVPSFNEVEERLGCRVRPILARREDILEKINEAYNNNIATDYIGEVGEDFEVVENQLDHDYAAIDEVAAESPVINLINSIIQRAVQDHASDIHIEPARGKSRVRFRIDGLLYEVMAPKAELHPALVSRLKVMANLDISERRLPQDGRIQVQTQGRSVDLRFSSLPGLYGEKVVLRVLDKNQAILDVNKLGMSKGSLNVFTNLLDSSYGLLLVTGPTGSGKTTSLYAAINLLKLN